MPILGHLFCETKIFYIFSADFLSAGAVAVRVRIKRLCPGADNNNTEMVCAVTAYSYYLRSSNLNSHPFSNVLHHFAECLSLGFVSFRKEKSPFFQIHRRQNAGSGRTIPVTPWIIIININYNYNYIITNYYIYYLGPMTSLRPLPKCKVSGSKTLAWSCVGCESAKNK